MNRRRFPELPITLRAEKSSPQRRSQPFAAHPALGRQLVPRRRLSLSLALMAAVLVVTSLGHVEAAHAEEGHEETGTSEERRSEEHHAEARRPPTNPGENPYEATTTDWAGADAAREQEDESGASEEEQAIVRSDEEQKELDSTPSDSSSSEVGPSESSEARQPSGPSAYRATAIALSGLAFVGVGIGASYAITSSSRRRLAADECTPVCTEEGQRLERRARSAATVARTSFTVGLAALGGAAYLWLTESSRARKEAETVAQSGWQFDFAPAPGGATASVGGNF